MLHEAQRDEGRHALAVGRDLVQRRALVRDLFEFDPLGFVSPQVFQAKRRPVGFRGLRDLPGESAVVEGLAFRLSDLAQGAGVAGALERLAGARGAAAGREGRHVGLKALVVLHRSPPGGGGDRREGVAIVGVLNRWLEEVGEGELAEALRKFHPGGDGPGRGDGIPAARGHVLQIGEPACFQAERRLARGVEAGELLAVPDDGKRIRADAVAGGFDNCQGNGGSKGGVNSIAAGEQHAQTSRRGERLRGRHDVLRQDRHALRTVGKGPVIGFHAIMVPGKWGVHHGVHGGHGGGVGMRRLDCRGRGGRRV